MAKKHSTGSTKQATQERIIGALLSHSDDATEATNSVRNVLWFMACALREGFDFAGDEKLLDGAGLILETCADTLSRYLPIAEKGGVA